MGVAILLLAAGASSRMRGGDKLLEQVEGEPLLRRQARAAQNVAPVYVTVSPDCPDRLTALAGLDVAHVEVEDASEGMGASIRAGVTALPTSTSAVMVVPADMPDLDADCFARLLRAHARHPSDVVRGTTESDVPGHPVLFPRRLFARLLRLQGDEGARSILYGEEVVPVVLPGEAAITDLDTPEAWEAWRSKRHL